MKKTKKMHVLHKDEHVTGAVNALVDVTGMPWFKAKNILLWRKKKGLSIEIRRCADEMEPA